MLELRNVTKTVARRGSHPRRVADARARLAQRPARPDAVGQDQPDAADGRARRADRRLGLVRRRRRHRRAGAEAQRRHGLPAVHQLPGDDGLREHRLAAARRRRRRGRDRQRGRSAPPSCCKLDALSRPHAAQPFRRPAAAHRAGPRHRQECRRWCCSTSRSPISTTSCARNCAPNCRASSPRPARSSSMPRPSRTRRCCSAATRRRCREGRVTQFGPTIEVFRKPHDLRHRADLLPIRRSTRSCCASTAAASCLMVGSSLPVPAELAGIADGGYTIGFQPHHLSLTRREPDAVAVPAQGARSPRSPARRASSISTSPTRAGSCWRTASTTSSRTRQIEVFIDPRHLMVFDATAARRPRSAGWRHRRAGWHASISTTSATPTWPDPQKDADYALKEVHHSFEDGGAYALLGPSGCGKTTLLNIISGLIAPVARPAAVRRRGRHRPVDAGAQHRAGVPVPGHLRHHDGLRQSRLPAAQPRRAGGRGRPQGARDPRDDRPRRPGQQAGRAA